MDTHYKATTITNLTSYCKAWGHITLTFIKMPMFLLVTISGKSNYWYKNCMGIYYNPVRRIIMGFGNCNGLVSYYSIVHDNLGLDIPTLLLYLSGGVLKLSNYRRDYITLLLSKYAITTTTITSVTNYSYILFICYSIQVRGKRLREDIIVGIIALGTSSNVIHILNLTLPRGKRPIMAKNTN
uniref:Uncharacterized protein n=1 Tax=Glossina brevipalpis TaxID=37001 RepID=A0A1A9WNN8_9MUSC